MTTVFISYSHKDEKLRQELEKHLVMLRRNQIIDTWTDRKLIPGQNWNEEINNSLESSKLIIFLVSANFLASDYSYNVEVQKAVQQHKSGKSIVIPIVLRPCDWSDTPFAFIQGLPKDAKPIIKWKPIDDGFLDAVNGIRRLLKQQTLQISNVTTEKEFPPLEKKPLIIPPYSLLQSERVIGRVEELGRLDNWLKEFDEENKQPFCVILGIGGMGKSALSWSWFQDCETKTKLTGKIWWSFYDNDSFRQFLNILYFYVLNIPRKKITEIINKGDEHIIFNELINTEKKYLIVLDGLERILKAYQSIDPFHKLDSEDNTFGIKQARNNDMINDLDGKKILNLFNAKSIKFLISTRLVPSIFFKTSSEIRDNVFLIELDGLNNKDALALWQNMGMPTPVDSESSLIIKYFNTFNNYPLVIKVLAGILSNNFSFRQHGSFQKWLEEDSNTSIFELNLNLVQVKTHILDFALRNLNNKSFSILCKMAAFKLNIKYEFLWDISKGDFNNDKKIFNSCLSDLESRSLIGWDGDTKTFDMHPVIRGVVWTNVAQDASKENALHSVEEFISNQIKNEQSESEANIRNAELLLVLFNNYLSQEKYEAAFKLLHERLKDLLLSDSYYNYFFECIDLLFPIADSPKVYHDYSSGVATGVQAVDESIKGKYEYARFIGMTHRLGCGQYYCEVYTAYSGIEYSKYKFNEQIYSRIIDNLLSGRHEETSAGYNCLGFFCLDLIDRGYTLEVNLILKGFSKKDISFGTGLVYFFLYIAEYNYDKASKIDIEYEINSNTFLRGSELMRLIDIKKFYRILLDTAFERLSENFEDDLLAFNKLFILNKMIVFEIQTYVMLAKQFLIKSDFKQSIQFAEKAATLSTKFKIVKREAESNIILAEAHIKIQNFEIAINHAKKAMELAFDPQGFSDYGLLVKAKNILSNLNVATGQYNSKLQYPESTKVILKKYKILLEL